MAATSEKYQPLQVSERDIPVFNTCTPVSTLYGVMGAMLGENVTWGKGSDYGYPALKKLITKARDATGEPYRAGYGTAHLNTFFKAWQVPLRKKEVSFIRDHDTIVAALKDNSVIVMAGDVGKTRANSPLRNHVNPVGHRMAFMGFRRKGGQAQTRLMDPMCPRGHKDWLMWVPVRDMFAFGSRYKHWNRYLAERYQKGYEAKAARVRRNMADLVLQVQTNLAKAQKGWQEADAEVDELVAKYNALDAKYQACMEGQGIPYEEERDVAALLAAALDKLEQTT